MTAVRTRNAHAHDDLGDRVRRWLVDREKDPEPQAVSQALDSLGIVAEPAVLRDLIARLRAELVGAGVLQELLDRPEVTDVLVNGAEGIWVDEGRGLTRVPLVLGGEESVRRLAQRLAARAGRRLDDAQPFVDARLPDGVRLHAVLAPVAAPGTLISLRVPARRTFCLDDLVAAASVSSEATRWLRALVHSRASFLVTGGTGSGKTTVLRALLELVPDDQRILVLEESAELVTSHPHCVRLEGRPPNAESAGGVSLTDLMRQAMRMRPDRIVVGEVRGSEITNLLAAMNTGHEGCCGTIHANSPSAVPARIEALALAAGLNRPAVHSQIAAGLDAVLHIDRGRDGNRRIVQMGVTQRGSGDVAVLPLLTFTSGRPRLHLPRHPLVRRLAAAMT